MKRMTMTFGRAVLLSVLGASAALGCSSPSASDDNQTAGQDLVDDPTFARAQTTIKTIDYLPFEYKADGCYARALYMSMELAAQQIESNAVFAIQKGAENGDAQGPPPQVGNISWGYHVAPVIEVGAASQPKRMVVDPALAQHPLILEDWLSTMHVTAETVTLVLMKGAVLDEQAALDLAHAQGGSLSQKLTENFSDMPHFKTSDVGVACRTMHEYLYYEAHHVDGVGALLPGATPVRDVDAIAQAAPKRAKLLARTTELVRKLDALGKLDGGPTFSEATCANHQDVALVP